MAVRENHGFLAQPFMTHGNLVLVGYLLCLPAIYLSLLIFFQATHIVGHFRPTQHDLTSVLQSLPGEWGLHLNVYEDGYFATSRDRSRLRSLLVAKYPSS